MIDCLYCEKGICNYINKYSGYNMCPCENMSNNGLTGEKKLDVEKLDRPLSQCMFCEYGKCKDKHNCYGKNHQITHDENSQILPLNYVFSDSNV